ncbi:hypothetical protein HRbin30_02679 [bacterium HR30]|nr:hypothetical protein HRbin30_02679 [bacterium HR30]
MPSRRRLRIHGDLRLKDLKRRVSVHSRLKNIRVPVEVADAVRRVAEQLGVTNTELVVALLNHGLHVTLQALEKSNSRGRNQRALPNRVAPVTGRSKAAH